MCALAEAVRREGTIAKHNILTVRCSSDQDFTTAEAQDKTAPLGWLWDISGVMSRCSEQVAEYQSHQILGWASHVVDLGIPGEIDQSSPEFFKTCHERAREAWSLHETALRNRFGPR